MSRTKVFSMPLLLLVLLTASCSRGEEALFEPGMGGVRIDLATELPETRADVAEGSLNTDEFKVELINSSGVIFKRWETFAEYKAQENEGIHMNAGHYKVRATYGDSTASGWDAWFFMGEQEFDVKPQEMEELSVVCKMANVKVAVVYGENLRADYQDYTATVSNSRGSLVFGKDCAEAGYLPVGTLSVNMELTDVSGKKLYYRSADVSAAAGDFITLSLDTKAAPQGGMGLSLDVDYGTNDKTVEVGISDLFLPAGEPELSLMGFDTETGQLSFVEGNNPGEASATVSWDPKASPIKSLILKTQSSYFEEHGLPAEVDLCSISSSDKGLLLEHGLVFPEMSGEMTAAMAKIQFEDLAEKLEFADDVEANSHTFIIEVTDSKEHSATKTLTIVPQQASKSLSEIQPGNVWARRAYLILNTDGDPSKLAVQVKESGTELWYTPEGTEYSVSGKTSSATVKGLKSNTKYAFRAVYNGFAATEAPEMTTETEQQVGNAGFEEWSEWEVDAYSIFGSTTKQKTYGPWKDEASKWWDTNNSETTKKSSTPLYLTFKCFPMVSYTQGRSGGDSKAAQIMAINVAGGNTDLISYGNAVQGRLFIGSYGGASGHQFGVRPSKMKFYYNYIPRGTDTFRCTIVIKNGDTEIGKGVFELTSGSSISNWPEAVVDIEYSNKELVATSLAVEFLQSTSTEPPFTKNVSITYPAGNKNVHGGSILTVDDIELIYE